MQEFIQNIINGLAQGSVYALVALGYTMVYGVLQFINFAHSDVFMLGAFAGLYIAGWMAGSSPVVMFAGAVLGAMVFCTIVALTVERIAYRPLRKAPRLNVLITAIGVSLFLEYGGQVVFGASPRFFPQMIRADTFVVGGIQITNQSLLIIVVALAMMFSLQFIVHRTRIGKAMRATSYNLAVAKLMGINTDADRKSTRLNSSHT